MAKAFDPYLKWLGIPPKHQPPNDYRLLGIEPFESDPEVINNAADQRMAHVKNFAAGKHSELSQRILNEISAARIRLLNTREKAKYDAALRRQLGLGERRSVPPKLPTAAPLAAAAPKPKPVISVDAKQSGAGSGAARPHGARGRRPPWLVPVVIGLGTCAAAVLLALLVIGDGDTKDTDQARRTGDDAAGPIEANPDSNAKVPGPTRPEPIIPWPTHPEPTRPEPSDPEPVNPEPTDPEPTDPEPTDPEPVHPEPTDPEPVNPEPTDPEPINPEPKPDPGRSKPPRPPDPPAVKAKLSEPDAAAKKEAQDSVRELYQEDFAEARTAPQRLALAEKLRRDALGTKDDPSARFVLLRTAVDLAARAEEADRALSLVDQIDQEYAVNVLEMKADALDAAAKLVVRRPGAIDANQQILFTARKLTNEALGNGDAKTARRFASIALPAARKLKEKELIVVLQSTIKELQHLEPRCELVRQAIATLKTDPDDPGANTEAGSWYCFVAGDWDKGLPWLAKGDDAQLAKLADDDRAGPTEGTRQVALGDRWWEVGKTKKGLERTRAEQRAVHWYEQALPRLSGLKRRELEKRLDELGVNVGRRALEFDGEKSHVLVYNLVYTGATPITVEALVKAADAQPGTPPVVAARPSEQTIIGNMVNSGLALGNYFGRWGFKSYCNYTYTSSFSSSSYISSRCYSVNSSNRAGAGDWVHLAGIFDGKEVRFYVDGERQRSYTSSTSYRLLGHKPSPLPFVIGAAPLGPPTPAGVPVGKFFHGAIKAVRISNSPLYKQDFQPPAELENLGKTTMLLFQFDEGKGDRLRDASGRKAYGTIHGAEWIRVE